MTFAPTLESLARHEVPAWFHDAKFGIFIHWGLYSVPAWAPVGADIQELIKKGGMEALMRNNPYAEWYMNSMKIPDHPTNKHHRTSYGSKFSYFDFQPIFEEAAAGMDPAAWADTFSAAGAKYVVMVTKHHDGYTLWPTKRNNPLRENYFSKRDFVGELTTEVRKRGLKMGHYYSGVLDWTFNTDPITDFFSFLSNQRQSEAYIEYANAHWYEIIERFETDILWNDIGYPAGADVNRLFADYYNTVQDGLINDRWTQTKVPGNPLGRLLMKAAVARMTRKMKKEGLELEPKCHYDFRTPEYKTYPDVRPEKWETCRGIGNSFGYNQLEGGDRMMTGAEIIVSLVDTVSKNGNLLLNVGPTADGTIPEMQKKPLMDLGAWLKRNGEAIYGTRPWTRPDARTLEGNDIRFTRTDRAVYATVIDPAPRSTLSIPDFPFVAGDSVELLGEPGTAVAEPIDRGVRVTLKADVSKTVAPVLRFARAS